MASAAKISTTVNTASPPIMIENWRRTLWSALLMEPLTHVLLSVGTAERHHGGPDLPRLPVAVTPDHEHLHAGWSMSARR
jgi:hypothetical protein